MYLTVEQVANNLCVSPGMITHFIASGWLSGVDKNGITFLTSHEEYKARFILHLKQHRKLTDEQIARVLFAQEPPFSLAAVDSILERDR